MLTNVFLVVSMYYICFMNNKYDLINNFSLNDLVSCFMEGEQVVNNSGQGQFF